MHVAQRSGRAPMDGTPSSSTEHVNLAGRGAGSGASRNMAGVGARRPGMISSSSRSYYPHDARNYHDYNNPTPWSNFDSSHTPDTNQIYGALSSAPSTSSIDTQSQDFDSASSLFTSHSTQSMQQLVTSIPEQTSMPKSFSANGTSASSSSNQRAISEADLLAFVNKRLKPSQKGTESQAKPSRNDRSAPTNDGNASTTTTDTLDLCHKHIDRVPDQLADMIKDQVVRLALGYNHIHKLPENFVDLKRLRYLNIRANNFSHFPDCVTKMPNLEILDLSRNKIRNLPQDPGRLLSLRVLSMNSNRISELPAWIGKMKLLRILKLDNNPIQWPPPHISKMPNVAPPKSPASSGTSAAANKESAKRFEDRQMLVWIAKLRSWINDPANSPHFAAASTARQLSLAVGSAAKAGGAAAASDLASPIRMHAPGLPEAASDGLMSLQVEVPLRVAEAASLQSKEPPTSSHAAKISVSSVSATSSDHEAQSAASGLLPSLVRDPSTGAESAESTSSTSRLRALDEPNSSSDAPEQNASMARKSASDARARSNSKTAPGGRPAAIFGSPYAMDDAEARQHARNNSHSVVQDIAATQQLEQRRSIKSKKSLPDLRQGHDQILQERREALAEQIPQALMSEPSRERSQVSSGSMAPIDSSSLQTNGAVPQPPSRKPQLQTRRAPRPSLGNNVGPSARQGYEGALNGSAAQSGAGSNQNSGGGLRKLSLPTVGATQAAADAAAAALAARAGYNNTPTRFEVGHVGHGRMASDRGDNNWPSRSASPTVNASRTAADEERNRYFRRLSTLPPSTISKAVPTPVLKFVDGTRGVLFALSQIHAAIGQFMTPVIDERISSQFHRLLDISNGSVANLINALDRFDSLSRRGTPDPSVIRGVLATCKDSVITFRKLISVLQLQLRALQSSSDVRYARTLLLMLYGSMGEVANSWTEMAPLVEAVQPYLTQVDQEASSPATPDSAQSIVGADKPTPPSTRSGTLTQKSTSNSSSGAPSTLPSIAEASTPLRAGSRPYIARGPSRRRHAGSFSAQDLAEGAAMTPSATNPPFNLDDLRAGSAYSTPARGGPLRRRQGSWSNSMSSAVVLEQSDASDRGGTLETLQSTPSGTPSNVMGASASQRITHATPGAMSTPGSSRQKRSGSTGSSAVEIGPLAAATGAATPRSQAGTPATPAAAAGSAKRHAASHSAGGTAASAAAGSRLHMAVSDPKITVDDHLLEMVDNITKLSARVWSMLFEHLRSAGIDDKRKALSEASPVDAENQSLQAVCESADKEESPSDENDREATADKDVSDDAETSSRLRELRELAQITDDLTSQLRSTYLRAREEETRRTSIDGESASPAAEDTSDATAAEANVGGEVAKPAAAKIVAASPENISQATVTQLFDESHQFVRAIVNTSTLIKTMASAHEFPHDLRRLLGQVAQACSNLTVYLLWLSPTSVS